MSEFTKKPLSLKPFVIFLALYVIWRYFSLYFIHPQWIPDNYEEIYRGTVARELWAHTPLSLWNYRPDSYSGGFYVIVIALALFLKLFGWTMLGLKTVGVLTGLCCLTGWYWLLAKKISERTAAIFSLLFIFAPQTFVGLSLSVLGDHSESMLLSAAAVLLYFLYLEAPDKKAKKILALLAILIGFSFWFAYIFGITIAALIFYHFFFLQRGVSPKKMVIVLSGLTVGLFFWFAGQFKTGGSAWVVQGLPIWKSFSWNVFFAPLTDWKKLFLIRPFFELPHRLTADRFWMFSNVLYFFTFTLTVLASFCCKKKISTAPIQFPIIPLTVIYLITASVAYQFYDAVGLRYFLPAYPFLCAWIAGRLCEVQMSRQFQTFLVGGLVIFGALTTFSRVSFLYPGEFLSRKSYSLRTLVFAPENSHERINEILVNQNLYPDDSDKIQAILAYTDVLDPLNVDASEIKKIKDFLPSDWKEYFEYKVNQKIHPAETDLKLTEEGTALFNLWLENPKAAAEETARVMEKQERLRAPILKTVGYHLANQHEDSLSSSLSWQLTEWLKLTKNAVEISEGVADYFRHENMPRSFVQSLLSPGKKT